MRARSAIGVPVVAEKPRQERISIRLPGELVARVDAYRSRLELLIPGNKVDRSTAIRALLEAALVALPLRTMSDA